MVTGGGGCEGKMKEENREAESPTRRVKEVGETLKGEGER